VRAISWKQNKEKTSVTDEIYRQLARRLDQIPNGFPAAPDGADLRLLRKIFTPEEAALAAGMRLTPETPAAIGSRMGMGPAETLAQLKRMAREGLVHMTRAERELRFGLRPFAVGFYEEQLPRMDAEMAALFEDYFQGLRGSALVKIHRVIPVEEAVPFEMQIAPHEQVTALVESARSWGVRDCICRTQQRLIGKGCDRPIGNCVTFAPIEGVFDHGTVTRPVSKTEALEVLRAAEQAGLVHTVANHRDGHSYICNCCPCCCGVLRAVTEFEIPSAVARSAYRIQVAADQCAGCEDCLARCAFGALAMEEGKCVADPIRCMGCGLCVSACGVGALRLEHREQAELPPLAENLEAWMQTRAAERSLDLQDIL
jgi:Na+-translocating ferredoxin:NAD+ oxidoreductase subunit B